MSYPVAEMAFNEQVARNEALRKEINRLEEIISGQIKEISILQTWNKSSWERGHRVGLQDNRLMVEHTIAALEKEKNAHSETNAKLTELLTHSEAKVAELKLESDKLFKDVDDLKKENDMLRELVDHWRKAYTQSAARRQSQMGEENG
jgi:cell division protein FtsB